MAAERLADAGLAVRVFERMPTVGRKLLIAGRGGLNLTHSEPVEPFVQRYGTAAVRLERCLAAFSPADLRTWAESLGQETFVGSSGRVFPKTMKSSPLLRAWLLRLSEKGVTISVRCRWEGWDDAGALRFVRADGTQELISPDVAVFALGGASWPRLGADGRWVDAFRARGIPVTPLAPANCGFDVGWSDVFRDRFAGAPLKRIVLRAGGQDVRGEAMITRHGLEGGAVYALSPVLREVARAGNGRLLVDLRPDETSAMLAARLDRRPAGRTTTEWLRRSLSLPPAAIGLLREGAGTSLPTEATALAALIKAVPLTVTGPRPIDRAISTAGGVALDAVDDGLMLRAMPGTFVAGEMLDWEAPTGGYLLQACLSTGRLAADGVIDWLTRRDGHGEAFTAATPPPRAVP